MTARGWIGFLMFLLCWSMALAQTLPLGSGGFPNEVQTPGELLSGLVAPSQGRTAIFAYHGDLLFSIPETPSSQPNSDLEVRLWDISDPRAPAELAQLGRTPMPIGAHGYFQSGNDLVIGPNGPSASAWTFRAMPDGSLLRTNFPGLLGISQRGHSFPPWFVGPTYRLYFPSQENAEIRRDGQLLATWDHLGLTGVLGHPFLLGNLLIFAAEESRTGVATYDISDPTNPVLLDVLRVGGAGGYWPELWAGGGRLYVVFPYRLEGNGFRVVDVTDPADLRFIADRPLSGATAQYAQFQDEYGFIGDHKIDMRSLQSVLDLDGANVTRPSDGGRGVDTSQFALPLGNLLVTGGIGVNQGMAIWAHQAAPDMRGPSVAYHIPRAGQTGYPVRAPISLLIHETLDSRTLVSGATVIVRTLDGTVVPGTLVVAFDDVITFSPLQPLQSNTTYEVAVPAGGIRDVAGNGVEAYAFTFSTGDTLVGNTPPSQVSVAIDAYPARPGLLASVTAQAVDAEAGPLQYRFDFGDGSATTAWAFSASAQHAYVAEGHYTITAQVRDAALAIASATTRATVLEPLSGAAPGGSSTVLCDQLRDRVWALDVDNDALIGIDTRTLERVANRPVCEGPRSVTRSATNELWIACERDDTLLVLAQDLTERARIDAGYGAAPVAVVASPDGTSVYASYAGRVGVVKFDAASRTEVARASLPAAARSLAVSADGAMLLAARFLSAANEAQVWHLSTAPLQLTRTTAMPSFGGELNVDTSASGRGLPNQLSGLVLSPRDATAWFVANKENTSRGMLVGPDLAADATVRNTLIGIDAESATVRRAVDLDNSDSAVAVSFSPLGDYLLIALQGNDEILVLDALSASSDAGLGTSVGRFAVGAAPQGLCTDAGSGRTFVGNFLGRSVTVLDTLALFENGDLSFARTDVPFEVPETLPSNVLSGKRRFYFAGDLRMSAEGYLSCATCHRDGGSDGLTWDFTGRGEGLRNTTDLRGRAGMAHGNVHWTANFDEIQDFENDIRTAFGGRGFMSDADYNATRDPLGPPKAGYSPELDQLAAYVQSLDVRMLPRSPFRTESGDETDAARRGRILFEELDCSRCHAGSSFVDASTGQVSLHDVGTLRSTSGSRLGATLSGIDTPTLLGVWATAPYFHDGSAETLDEVFVVAGGRVVPAENGSVRGNAQIVRQFTEINNDDSVRGRAYAAFASVGGGLDFTALDAGGAGRGAIELRYSSAAAGSVDIVVGGTRYPMILASTGNSPAFRRTRWRSARAENVLFAAGASNSVSIEITGGTGMNLGIDEIVVSGPAEIALAQPHRVALTRSAAEREDLIAYLRQLDSQSGAEGLFSSGFESSE